MSRRHHLWNMYITAAVSVTMVLCLVGLECVLLLSAGTLMRHVKENVAITALLKGDADSASRKRFEDMLSAADYCSNYRYISAEDALDEHIRTLGEDPSTFLGYNPLTASYEIHPTVAYANSDSICVIESRLLALPYIDNVLYQKDLVQALNSNVSQVAIVLLIIAGILLLIACVLIINTIRLQVYSKRFLINTMTLVGASPWTIKSPFVYRYTLLGIVTALVATIAVGGVVYYVQIRMGIVLFPLTWQNIAFVAGVIFLSGFLITFFSSLIATERYIRMDINTMYEI
ncbi:MAG: permease-like cell division protein FtsX [Paludibacteraceae bacterium]|nr:permease-like cell division protein FtsX [Paludibacteraceae bacterium]